ncbi:hypothetical protein ACTNDP_22135 [Paenibacillus barengoltzii]|uniref:hypothetical protein n=1 Tax=Paenibacillus TaxID=44249 RepID=UPI0028FD446B|nr:MULTISPECIES: hypothetical protein [Paenibacillus]MDU0331954.1 hypothetical protein [Paenibacillus sp. 3LSP]MEC2345951.1 hypothetical protein [Paenibacillus barengoltzii]
MLIVINPEPRDIIDTYIPMSIRSRMCQAIVDAYKWSDILLSNTSIFKSVRGKKRLLPEIKNVAVEFFIVQAIKNGEIPLNYRIKFNSNFSHPFLELYNNDVLIHINQVKSKNQCARKAFCRDRLIKPIQSYIDVDSDQGAHISYDSQKYFQMNHGYQTSIPSFVNLGIPNSRGDMEASIQLLEEYRVVEGFYPKSQIETIDEFTFEEFQRYAEGEGANDSRQTS